MAKASNEISVAKAWRNQYGENGNIISERNVSAAIETMKIISKEANNSM
jgi:hypothetical protein